MHLKKALIFGIGNPGRGDDGLGPALIERLRQETADANPKETNPVCVCKYQLNIEDAYAIKDHDLVVFADATASDESAAALAEVFPSDTIAFTTHRMSPASVLALCHELFGRAPKAYILSIRGTNWAIGEGLSSRAEENLAQALDMLLRFLADNPPTPR